MKGNKNEEIITGRSPYPNPSNPVEWFSTPVWVKAIGNDLYGSNSKSSHRIEIKIGRGKRSRIVQLQTEEAYRLVYKLIEASRKVEVNVGKEDAFDEGQTYGYKNGLRDGQIEKRQKL